MFPLDTPSSAAPAIVTSAATVVAGLLCLLVADLNSTSGLGPIGAAGILCALVAMLTLFPAVLVVLGQADLLAGRPAVQLPVPRYSRRYHGTRATPLTPWPCSLVEPVANAERIQEDDERPGPASDHGADSTPDPLRAGMAMTAAGRVPAQPDQPFSHGASTMDTLS